MTWGWKRTVAPTLTPVSVDQMRANCHVTHVEEDLQFEAWIAAAVDWVERYTRRGLMTQTYQVSLPGFVSSMPLPYASPVQTVSTVKYYDTSGTLQTLSPSPYRLIQAEDPACLELDPESTLPEIQSRRDAVQITYLVGATSPNAVPAALVQAVTMLAAHFYANRESVLVGAVSKEIEFATTALCAPYRVFWGEPC